MIFGDSQIMRNGRLAPNRFAIMQAGNLYMYTMHNPVMFSDPSGRVAIFAAGLLGKAAANAVAWLATGAIANASSQAIANTASSLGSNSASAVVIAANSMTKGASTITASQNCSSANAIAAILSGASMAVNMINAISSTASGASNAISGPLQFGVATQLIQSQSVGSVAVTTAVIPGITAGVNVPVDVLIGGGTSAGGNDIGISIGGGSAPGDPNDPNNQRGMGNQRLINNLRVKGYRISMDMERGGSGQINIHLQINNTKYFYNHQAGQFFSQAGNSIPGSLQGNAEIAKALQRALKLIQGGW